MTLRIALVDDHQIFREGLRAILRGHPDLTVVAECGDARELYPLLEVAAPHVAVVDLTLRGSSGIAATEEILRRSPQCRVLVLTMHNGEEHVARAFRAGATGYAVKEQSAAEVVEAIRTVAAGRRYLAPSISPAAVGTTSAGTGVDALTSREREIFDLILQARSNLGAHSTADLVRLAARLNILPR
jgi:DNA-binding NarL/FixJ family response regulator